MAKKSMALALLLSIIFTGLGLIYADDAKKGLILFIIAIVGELLFWFVSMIFGMVVFIVWIYSLYATYQQVKLVNGQ